MNHAVIGHHNIQQQIAALAAANAVPHALLIHGPEGIGKRTLCNHLAHFIICGGDYKEGQGLTLNPNSRYHAQLQANTYPDLHLLEKTDKTTISVEATRNLLERLTWATENPRLIIIDSLDDLNEEAANTLLKTLEEPSPGAYFLLIAHQLAKVLPTILSRCRKLAAQPLTLAETRQVLTQQPDLSATEIETLIQRHPHSPGQALAYGAGGVEISQALTQAFTATSPAFAKLADKLAQKKHVPQALDLLLQEVHDITVHHLPTLASHQRQQAAELYQHLQQLKTRQNTHNLTPAWVLETALTAAAKTQIAAKLPPFFRTSRM